jgi:predicted flap endonuclease-1-like 5' DNA nuclease
MPTELLSSVRKSALVEQLLQRFDGVLFDTPAYLPLTDAALLAPIADMVLLVIRCRTSRRETVLELRQQLANARVKPIGLVVNRTTSGPNGRYYNYYYSDTVVTVEGDRLGGHAPEPQALPAQTPPVADTPEAPSEPDLLHEIRGIGPVYERALHALGIGSFAQLVEQDPDDLAGRMNAVVSAKRIRRDCWIEQARAFAFSVIPETAQTVEQSPIPEEETADLLVPER